VPDVDAGVGDERRGDPARQLQHRGGHVLAGPCCGVRLGMPRFEDLDSHERIVWLVR
jgi:hypothetical protein